MFIVIIQTQKEKVKPVYMGNDNIQAEYNYKYYAGKGKPTMLLRDGTVFAISTQTEFNSSNKGFANLTGKGIKV